MLTGDDGTGEQEAVISNGLLAGRNTVAIPTLHTVNYDYRMGTTLTSNDSEPKGLP